LEKILRVFPHKTRATPIDELVRIGVGPEKTDFADRIDISVTFSWDLPLAESLADQWRVVAPVSIGGPATGQRSEAFISGQYIGNGYTITSRGCPNKCWFCSVWKREGDTVRELPIVDGWNVLDDNLLACSDDHIKSVLSMLERQKNKPVFTGGLEAKRLKLWQAVELKKIKTQQMFFAYDTQDDLEPLVEAGKLLRQAGYKENSHALRAYVLCGWPKDTMSQALARMHQTIDAGFYPMAMLWRDKTGETNREWRQFQRVWANPYILFTEARKYKESNGPTKNN